MKRVALDALILFALPLFLVRNVQLFQAELTFHQAQQLSQEHQEDQAFPLFARAAAMAPGHAEYQRAVGRSALRLFDLRPHDLAPLYRARQAYERVLKEDAAYPYDRFELGEVLEALRSAGVPDLPDPEPYLQQALAIDPTNPLFLSGLMTWQTRHGRKIEARRLFLQAAISGPPSIRLFGPALLTTHEERLQFALELGRHPDSNFEYGLFLAQVKEPELAKQQLTLAQNLIQVHPERAPSLAKALAALGETKPAEEVLAQAFARNPQYVFVGEAWAQLLIQQKDLPGAIAVYQRALRLNPKAWQFNLSLARLYSQTGQNAQALDQFDAVLEANQANTQQRQEIFVAQGEIKLKQGDLRGAMSEFEKALEISPNDSLLDKRIKQLKVQIEYQGQNQPTP